MNGKRAACFVLPMVLWLSACGGSTASGADPQAPAPANPKIAAASVVICPDASSYAPGRNACVATTGATSSAQASAEPQEDGNTATVRVQCSFPGAWVALVPEEAYPDNDEFILQALIGFTEEPDVWAERNRYRGLSKYAASRCSQQGKRFDVRPGPYFVLVAEASKVGRRTHRDEGYRRRIDVSEGESLRIKLELADLNHIW